MKLKMIKSEKNLLIIINAGWQREFLPQRVFKINELPKRAKFLPTEHERLKKFLKINLKKKKNLGVKVKSFN